MSETNIIDKNTTVPELLLRAANPKMILISVASVFGGTAAAALRGNMELLPATLCLIFAVLTQLAGSYWHYYTDIRMKHEAFEDDDNPVDNDFGSIPGSSVLREAAIGFLIMDAIIGLSLLTMAGLWTLVVAAAVIVINYFTFGGPCPLLRTPFGLLTTFLLFGPVAVIGTTLVQSGHEANTLLNYYDVSPALYVAAVLGLMAVNCNLTHNLFHISLDKFHGRITLPMISGKKLTKTVFVVNGFVWTAITAALCLEQNLSNWWMYMLVPVIVLAVNCRIASFIGEEKSNGDKVQLAANINMLAMALAMLITSLFIGAADDSALVLFVF